MGTLSYHHRKEIKNRIFTPKEAKVKRGLDRLERWGGSEDTKIRRIEVSASLAGFPETLTEAEFPDMREQNHPRKAIHLGTDHVEQITLGWPTWPGLMTAH